MQTCIAPWGDDGLDDYHQLMNNGQDFCWLVRVSEWYLFDSIEMMLLPRFVEKYMPKDFVVAGYNNSAAIGDETEVWIS